MTATEMRVAGDILRLQRAFGPDHPRLIELRTTHPRAASLADRIKRDVDADPPLTGERREQLADLLRPYVVPRAVMACASA